MTMVESDIAERYRQYLEQFGSRRSDIWVATFSKSGTTWMQMILYQLTTSGDMDFDHLFDVSPWVYYAALRGIAPASPPDPRILKTHDDYTFMATHCLGKTVYVIRDGKDVAVSWYHHRRNFQGFEGSFDHHFEEFLNAPNYNWFVHVKDWLANRLNRPVFVVKYEDLIEDFDRCVAGVANFFGLEVDEIVMARARERSTFDFMKTHEAQLGPRASHFPAASDSPYKIKSGEFLRRGRRGEGVSFLSKQQLNAYHRKFDEVLGDLEAVAEYR
jgi:hypothetical protein